MSPKQATVVKQEKNMNLIEAVRRYPFLYDKKDESFKDFVKKNAQWSKIAEEVEIEDPAERWKNLRDQYQKKKQIPSTGSTPTTKWPYLDELRFLDKTREESDLRDSTGSEFFDEEDVFQDRTQSSVAASMTDVTDLKQDKRKRKRSNVETIQSPDKLDEFLDRAMQPESGNEIFGKFVASEMDGLSPVNQVLAKQNISQLLTQLKLKELTPAQDSQHPFVSSNGMDYTGGYLQL